MEYDSGAQDTGLRITDKVVPGASLITHLNHPPVDARNQRIIHPARGLVCEARIGRGAAERLRRGPNSDQKFSVRLNAPPLPSESPA